MLYVVLAYYIWQLVELPSRMFIQSSRHLRVTLPTAAAATSLMAFVMLDIGG